MSFQKAEQLLELATLLAANRYGVTLDQVVERFGVSLRTAQRMLRALEAQFPDVQDEKDEAGRKRWYLPPAILRELVTVTSDELAALDLALETFEKGNLDVEAATLRGLREKILALVPRDKATRLETDHEALLEAQGFATRPGPRPKTDGKIFAAIAECIKACRVLEIDYKSHEDAQARKRQVEPHGVLTGPRRYLVARPVRPRGAPMRYYRIDSISKASVTKQAFERAPDFDLRGFSRRAFGVFQNEEEYGEVIWRFKPEAAGHARAFEFHPDQTVEEQEDGSLVVRFNAAGHLEMCWYLYAWGNRVEVLAPEKLRQMVEGFQRNDFKGLP